MTTKRAGRAERTTTTTRTSKSTRPTKREPLSAQEEKVLRMRRGVSVPSTSVLGRVGQDHAKTKAWLDALEQRAFERSGRLDELRREAGVAAAVPPKAAPKAAPAARLAKKEKIISRLAEKAPSASKAKVTASGAVAKARAKKR